MGWTNALKVKTAYAGMEDGLTSLKRSSRSCETVVHMYPSMRGVYVYEIEGFEHAGEQQTWNDSRSLATRVSVCCGYPCSARCTHLASG